MKPPDLPLDRLFRAAAATTSELPNEMPFGFDTRVLARWREELKPDFLAVTRLLRRVVLLALTIIISASAAAYHELGQSEESEIFFNQYAIADNAIGNAVDL